MSDCAECNVENRYCPECHEHVREDFCPSCLIVPLAVAGVGATGIGMTTSKKHKLTKQIMLITGVITLILALGFGMWFIFMKKDCKECTLKY